MRLPKVTTVRAAIAVAAVGVAVFFIGLWHPFMGDDIQQIVNNPLAHSAKHIPSFFSGGTFYDDNGNGQLSGVFYRPLMMTVYALIYTVFGAHPVMFHVVQMLLFVGAACFLFLILQYFLYPSLALGLALVFLAHPINSGNVYSTPALQEPLMMLLGLLGFWLLLQWREKPWPWMLIPYGCFALALSTKETAVLFLAIAMAYVVITNRKRAWIAAGLSIVVLVLYMSLRLHAVGHLANPHNAPIDELDLWQRLLNIPAIVWFYIEKFMFPLGLAEAYYWVYPTVTLRHFVLPLVLDLVTLGGLSYAGWRLWHQGTKRQNTLFVFFAAWFLLGLAPTLQLFPLDMTASETWFIFPMVGLLGMVGVLAEVFLDKRIPRKHLTTIFVVIIMLLGFRTGMRGLDWRDPLTLSRRDVAVSKEDYVSYGLIANDLLRQQRIDEAEVYALRSIDIYPTFTNYNTLGAVLAAKGKNAEAIQAMRSAIKYGGDSTTVYHNLAVLYATSEGIDQTQAKDFFETAVAKFPNDGILWDNLALFAHKYGYESVARMAIDRARQYGVDDQVLR